ncbi:MAG: PAS domain S-box protein [Pedobacter sp.]|nr:MAG: PAS domain S-box protein [Pedobacter sp.]
MKNLFNMDNTPMHLDAEHLLGMIKLMKNPISVHAGEDATVIYANPHMLAVWGKDSSIIGKPLEEGLPEMKGQPFREMFATSFREGKTYSGIETPADLELNGNLGTYYFDFSYQPVRNSDGKIIGVMNSAIDVTERVKHRQTLDRAKLDALVLEKEQAINEKLVADKLELESQVLLRAREAVENAQQFKRLVEQAPVAIAVFRTEELFIDIVNPSMLEIWGKKSSILGLPLSKAMPELDGQPFIGILQNVIACGTPFFAKESKAFVMHGGVLTEGYYNFICQPLKNPDGTVSTVLQMVTEVTEQVVARLEVQRTKEMMDMAIDAANLGSWRIDPETRNLAYNDALARMYGYVGDTAMTFDQAIAQVTDEHKGRLLMEIDKALESGGVYDVTFEQRRFDNDEVIWLKSFGKVNLHQNGQPIFTGFVMDVTEAKKDEQRKHDFISIVSHELKTPLTSLNGYLQLLQRLSKKAEDVQTGKIADSAVRQLKRMNEMVNGFLDLSRLESGKLILELSTFDFEKLVREMVAEAEMVDSSHRFELISCDSVEVVGDRLKIASVISNLLSNAAKYSPGSDLVTISCDKIEDQIHLSVIDKGIGIAPEHIDNLFDRFYRVNSSGQVSGFGIGLYLSREVITRHQGKIWAESKLGEGSTFHFSLPII